MYRSLTSVLALAAAASAATIKIDVGEDSTIKFNPNTITANPGDQ
jgi:plastocyanin